MLLLFAPSAELPEWFVAVAGVCYAAAVLGILFLILRLIFRGLLKSKIEVRYIYVEKNKPTAHGNTARKLTQKVVR